MQWQVTGAHRETGHKVVISVEADTAADAERLVQPMGVLVSRIEPVASQLDELAAARADMHDLHRRLMRIPTEPVPDYMWLRGLGRAYMVIGAIVMGFGILIGLLAVVASLQPQNVDVPNVLGVSLGIGVAAASFLCGTIYLAIGQALLAFRDLARNSWKLNTIAKAMTQ